MRIHLPFTCGAVAMAIVGVALAKAQAAAPQPAQPSAAALAAPDPAVLSQLQAARRQTLPRTAAERKLSSNLLLAVRGVQPQTAQSPQGPLKPFVGLPQQTPDPRGQVVIIRGDITPDLQAFVRSQGGTGLASEPRYHAMSARVPLKSMTAIAERPEVKSITVAQPPTHNQAAPARVSDTDGDIAHEGATVRTRFGADGTGVKVCVMSDGVDSLRNAQSLGTLGPVEVLPPIVGQPLRPGDEGTAMLEIVHRLAPGASLAFADSSDSRIGMAQNIDRLAADGCRIIVDDISYADETPYQDGEIARSAKAATQAGILYFSSAANSGNEAQGQSGTWEGDFNPSQTTITLPSIDSNGQVNNQVYRFHQFAPGRVFDIVTAVNAESPVAILAWNDPDDPASNSLNDYILAVFDDSGKLVAFSSTMNGGGRDLPLESVQIAPNYKLAILKADSDAQRVVRIVTNRGRLWYATDGATAGHNALGGLNAYSVAAVSAQNRMQPFSNGANGRRVPDLDVESYSSDGPRRMYYAANAQPLTTNLSYAGGVKLLKPDFSAADCVATQVADFQPFCGTSAAAPHAAAIAAMLLSIAPHADVGIAFFCSTLITKRITLTNSRCIADWDDAAGFGLLNPVPAVRGALNQQGFALENFSEAGPVTAPNDASGNLCGLSGSTGGAAPLPGGAGWTVPAGGWVQFTCKGVPANAIRFEGVLKVNFTTPGQSGGWSVQVARWRAGTHQELTRTWLWNGSFDPNFGGVRPWNVDALPTGTPTDPIDVEVTIYPRNNVSSLVMKRFRIGPPPSF